MTYIKINEDRYPATFTGKHKDNDWGDREQKTILTSAFTYEEIKDTFVDGLEWFIEVVNTIEQLYAYNEDGEEIYTFEDEEGNPIPLFDKDGNPIDEPLSREVEDIVDYDNSQFNVAGSVTDNRDGSFSIKMGMTTDLEEAYELLYGGAN